MKNLLFLCLSLCLFFACNEAPKKTPTTTASSAASLDSVAITKVIHGFYQWYLVEDSGFPGDLPFVVVKKGKQKFDVQKFESWGLALLKSGFVSSEYLTNAKAYFKNCEPVWATENLDEAPPTCPDSDLFTCLQDDPNLLIDQFTKSTFSISKQGEGRAIASSEENGINNIGLKLENGKWLLTNFGCVAAAAK